VYPTSYPEGPITSEPSTFQGTHCGGWEGSDGVLLEEEEEEGGGGFDMSACCRILIMGVQYIRTVNVLSVVSLLLVCLRHQIKQGRTAPVE